MPTKNLKTEHSIFSHFKAKKLQVCIDLNSIKMFLIVDNKAVCDMGLKAYIVRLHEQAVSWLQTCLTDLKTKPKIEILSGLAESYEAVSR